ncbi:MAG: Uma2 family endonuclease [Bryobacter sp.]|nr:Uma2 family endonuclease [Bryobacter sp.]
MASTATLISRAEYDARTAAGERLDFDDGVIIPMPNNDSLHDGIKLSLARLLNRQLEDPIEAGNELAFEVAPDRVRHPDVAVCLTRRARIAGKRFQGPPDLAIEIVSDSDSAKDLDDKIRLYLKHGARAVWVVWPEDQRIDIHQLGQPVRAYHAGETLANEEPIPSFRLSIAALFQL